MFYIGLKKKKKKKKESSKNRYEVFIKERLQLAILEDPISVRNESSFARHIGFLLKEPPGIQYT